MSGGVRQGASVPYWQMRFRLFVFCGRICVHYLPMCIDIMRVWGAHIVHVRVYVCVCMHGWTCLLAHIVCACRLCMDLWICECGLAVLSVRHETHGRDSAKRLKKSSVFSRFLPKVGSDWKRRIWLLERRSYVLFYMQ
jgi:hypothetical protein